MPVRVALIASLVLASAVTPALGASFSGTLRDGYGTPIDRATVSFATSTSQASGVTDGLGHFRLEAAPGAGSLSVSSGSSLNPVRTPPSWWVQAPMTLVADTVQDVTLPAILEMAVRVTETDGSPVQGAWVKAWGDSATWFELFPGTQAAAGTWTSGLNSDELGYVRWSYFAPIHARRITADYQPPNSFPRSVSAENVGALHDTTVTLVLPPPPAVTTFSGTLRDGYGTPIDRATLNFRTSAGEASGVTDGLGHFRLEAAPGAGSLSVSSGSSLNPVRTPPWWWVQAPMTLVADTVQDLALPTTVEMAIRVIEVGGSPVQGAWVRAPGDTSASCFELHFAGTQAVLCSGPSSGSSDSLGYVRLSYFAPIHMRLITADYQPPNSFPRSVSVENVGALHDTTVTLVLPPRAGVASFSGTLRDGYGTPVGQAMIQFDAVGRSGSGMSDELGHFRFEAPIGPGSLLVSRNLDRGWPPPGYVSHWWVRTPMALNADTVQDLSLPKPVELTIRLVEADGSPVTGFAVSALGDSIAPFELFPGSEVVGGSMPPSAVDTLQPGFVQIACFPEAWIQEISAQYQPSPSSPIRRASIQGIVALRDTTLTLVMLDTPTGTLVSLASAGYQAGAIRLLWWVGPHQQVTKLYRRTRETAWQSLATVSVDGTGMIRYDDAAITPGTSYGYRLGISDGATESYSGEAWVDVPALRLALYGVRPNPALSSELHAHFALPDASPASLLLYDAAGRVLQAREVGSLGAGEHMVEMRPRVLVSPGVYLLRLTQGGRVLNAKAVVIR